MSCPYRRHVAYPVLASIGLAVSTALAQTTPTFQASQLSPESVEQLANDFTQIPIITRGAQGPVVLRAQVLLDRAGFSPGVIDGSFGSLATKAVMGFQEARGLPVTGSIDAATWAALQEGARPALVRLAISANDAAGPFIASIPDDYMEQAKLPALFYTSIAEALAEKFHTTPAVLAQLNPGVTTGAPGITLLVPNVRDLEESQSASQRPAVGGPNVPAEAQPAVLRSWDEMLNDLSVEPDQPKAGRVVVDKSDRTVRVLDGDGKLLAQFPATIGSEHDPLPIGTWKINGTSKLPPFHYNPDLFWDAEAKDEKATLKPGPNNPVGVVWIDLSKAHYGIHGTPVPETISRTASHGCIRLTNWDAARLAQMVSPGIVAVLQE